MVGTDEMEGLWAKEDHHCSLKHLCLAEVQLPSCVSTIPCCTSHRDASSSPRLICCPQILTSFGDPLPWDKAFPLPSQGLQISLGAQREFQPLPCSHMCPGRQGHVAEAGVVRGPCPWSTASLQMYALLGAVCNLHTELPLLLRRVALMCRAAGRAPASAWLTTREGMQALSLPACCL